MNALTQLLNCYVDSMWPSTQAATSLQELKSFPPGKMGLRQSLVKRDAAR